MLDVVRRSIPSPIRQFLRRHLLPLHKRDFATFLRRTLPAKLSNNTVFVQIGAHYRTDDIVRSLAVERGWRGLLIEPDPRAFSRLSANYGEMPQFTLLNLAISNGSGSMPFYSLADSNDLPHWYDQIGSFNREHIVKHFDPSIEDRIQTHLVACDILRNVFDKHGITRADLLHIDTEGFDLAILKQIDFHRFAPAAILYEHKHLNQEDKNAARLLLMKHGYRLRVAGEDTLAIRRRQRNAAI